MGQAIKKFGWKRSDLVITTKVTKSHTSKPLRANAETAASLTGVSRTAKSSSITTVSRANTSSKALGRRSNVSNSNTSISSTPTDPIA